MTWIRKRPKHCTVRVPPAWTGVKYNTNPRAACQAMGTDAAGRCQRLYSAAWVAKARSGKFERVKALLEEFDDIGSQIKMDLNDKDVDGKDREAALVAYLIYNTGMRPGGQNDGVSAQTYGACNLQLRHIKPCVKGVRLQFVGKKGVKQNVLVIDPYLVRLFKKRKRATTAWSTRVFDVSSTKVNQYIAGLGSGDYTAKDLRTACGTSLALELLGNRQRLPRAMSRRKKLVNRALDQVARKLGNTRAIARHSYVAPEIVNRILEGRCEN